ncbi:MAG: Mur ligase family protein, partial [Bacteroidota bacterium]
MIYAVQQIAEILHADALIRVEQSIQHLITDSRSVMPSGTSLFFAIKGENHNGHDYLEAVYEKGCRSFVLSERFSLFEDKSDVNILYVDCVILALQKLAAYHRSMMHTSVLSVTGSNGKTVVKEWLWQLLAPDINISRSPRSYNSQVGVPLSLWLIDPEDQLAIIEAGISKPGEMELLEKMIFPDTGIFTNIGEAHQENFNTLEEKINEKIKLFKNTHAIVFCYDHEKVRRAIKNKCPESELFSWSLSAPEADLFFKKTGSEPGKTNLELENNGNIFEFVIPFEDQASVENALHVIAYAIFRGIEPEIIRKRIQALQPVGMRMEMIKGAQGCTLINDAYNSDLYAINIAVDFLNAQPQNNKKTVILSDVLQSGKPSEEIYQQIAQLLCNSHIDRFIGVGPEMVRYANFFDIPDKFVYPSTDALIDHLGQIRFHDEL